MRLHDLQYLFKEGCRNTWQNRLMALASVGVLVCCLLLTGFAYILFANVDQMSQTAYEQNVIAVYLDGKLIQHFSGDGLIIATPTGSTGYSMSAGGSLVLPGVDLMLLTPICAHTPHAKPTVVPAGARVDVVLKDECEAVLAMDGRRIDTLPAGGRVSVCRAERDARFIRMGEGDFFGRLKSKLMNWGQ